MAAPAINPDANYSRNLAALRARFPAAADLVEGWTDRHEFELAPAEGGGWVLLLRTGAGTAPLSETAQPEQKARDWAEANRPGPPDYQPVLLCGVRAGYEPIAMYERLHRESGGRRQAMYVVEGSPDLFKAAMQIHDLTGMLSAENVFVFVGPEAACDFERFLIDDAMKPLPAEVIPLGGEKDAKAIVGAAVAATTKRGELALEVKRALDRYYDAVTPRDWIDALGRGGDLRVLLISSGHSWFVRYANRDIADALSRLGHRTRTIAEADCADAISALAVLRAIDEFKPHIVHHIDHVRAEWPEMFPARLPFLTSILDHFPTLENPDAAARAGDWDFFTGYVSHWRKFGYRVGRVYGQEPMTNERIFRPVELSAAQKAKYECDASFLSNIGKPPDAYLPAIVENADRMGRDAKALVDGFYEAVEARFVSGEMIDSVAGYEEIFRSLPSADAVSPEVVRYLVHAFNFEVGSAFFRQLPLIALSEAGIDLHLYGREWDRHPKLAKHARGVAEHGEETNLILNASRINLHINQFAIRHNRLTDGYAAGAFFLVHDHADRPHVAFDLEGVTFRGAGGIVELADRFLGDPAARRANADFNRGIALERFTYEKQYANTLRLMKNNVCAEMLLAIVDEGLAARGDGDPPLCGRLADRSLDSVVDDLTGLDLTAESHRLWTAMGDWQPPAQSWPHDVRAAILNRFADADEAARHESSARFVRPRSLARLSPSVEVETTGLLLPCDIAPDGRLAAVAYRGADAECDLLLVDPGSGSVERIGSGTGMRTGSLGPDGWFYAYLHDQGRVARMKDGRWETVIDRAAGDATHGQFDVRCLADGRICVHETPRLTVRLYAADGRFERTVVESERFGDLRSVTSVGGDIVYLGSGRLLRESAEERGAPVPLPEPPAGRYGSVAAFSDRFVATTAEGIEDAKGVRHLFVRGIVAGRWDGSFLFAKATNPFPTDAPVMLIAREIGGAKSVLAVEPHGRRVWTLTAVD